MPPSPRLRAAPELSAVWQAWSVNRYAMVARKHGLYHTCIDIINHMYGFNAMEVQEAFTKIKEQARSPPRSPGRGLRGPATPGRGGREGERAWHRDTRCRGSSRARRCRVALPCLGVADAAHGWLCGQPALSVFMIRAFKVEGSAPTLRPKPQTHLEGTYVDIDPPYSPAILSRTVSVLKPSLPW